MNRAIMFVALSASLLLVNSIALGQKRSTRAVSAKPTASTQRVVCKGQPVPKGSVVVGYKVSEKCGANPELIIKKPAETEIVCDASPIPEGYHVVSQQASLGCAARDSNPLNNALEIVRDGSSSSATRTSASNDPNSYEPIRRTKVIVSTGNARNENEQPQSIVQKRAEEEQRKTKIELAVLHHEIMVGMTTEQVLTSWGRPDDSRAVTESGSGTTRTWTYHRRDKGFVDLHFENDILSNWTWFH